MQNMSKYWCIIICLFFIGCNSGKQPNNKNDYKLNLDELRKYTLQLENDLINNITNFLNDNRQEFLGNGLKGIYSLHLSDEQEIFYNKRLDFFIAILHDNEKTKREYYNCAYKYYKKFPTNSKYYYFWSKDVFDFRLFRYLENEFGEIKLPINYLGEFCREIDTHWEYEINEE
jgi:hypothetical protein